MPEAEIMVLVKLTDYRNSLETENIGAMKRAQCKKYRRDDESFVKTKKSKEDKYSARKMTTSSERRPGGVKTFDGPTGLSCVTIS